jgi:hypothetical protein
LTSHGCAEHSLSNVVEQDAAGKALAESGGRAPGLALAMHAEERTNAQRVSFFGETSGWKHALVLVGGFDDSGEITPFEGAARRFEDSELARVLLGVYRARRSLPRPCNRLGRWRNALRFLGGLGRRRFRRRNHRRRCCFGRRSVAAPDRDHAGPGGRDPDRDARADEPPLPGG